MTLKKRNDLIVFTNNTASLIKIHHNISSVNRILTHTWQILNLYCIYLHDEKKSFPIFNVKFILNIFRLISGGSFPYIKTQDPSFKERAQLKIFFEEYYQ